MAEVEKTLLERALEATQEQKIKAMNPSDFTPQHAAIAVQWLMGELDVDSVGRTLGWSPREARTRMLNMLKRAVTLSLVGPKDGVAAPISAHHPLLDKAVALSKEYRRTMFTESMITDDHCYLAKAWLTGEVTALGFSEATGWNQTQVYNRLNSILRHAYNRGIIKLQ